MKTFSFVFDLLNFKLGIFFLFQNGGTKKQHRLIHKPCTLPVFNGHGKQNMKRLLLFGYEVNIYIINDNGVDETKIRLHQ